MKLHIFAIKDASGNEFQTPFVQPTPQQAVRVMRTEVNRADTQNLIYLYPDEFELHQVGIFDTTTGELTPNAERLCVGTQLKIKT